MKDFFKALAPAIRESVKTEMKKIHTAAEDERIYAAALVTDSDCVTLFLAVNTEESLAWRDRKDRTEKRLAMLRQYYSQELADQVAEGSFSLNRYLPDEWDYSDGKDSGLNQVSKQLFDKEASLSDTPGDEYDEVHERFQNLFLETVIEVFQELREEGVFGPEVTCFVSMSDDDRAEEIEDDSARRLNTREQYEQFRTWKERFNG